MVELIILKFSDASFPYLPSNFLTTLHFNNLSYPTLKTLDFNMHWKSICHESGRENLLEKIRSCWWLICHVGIKAFKNSLSAGLSARHITQSVHRWPVLPISGVRLVQFGLIALLPWRAGTTGGLLWHVCSDTTTSAPQMNFRDHTTAVHFSKSHQPTCTWNTVLAEREQYLLKRA